MNICYVVAAMHWSVCSFFKRRNALKICMLLLQSFVVIVLLNACCTSQKWVLDRIGLSPAHDDENQTLFLNRYSKYCEEFLLPKEENVRAMKIANDSRLCPCIPDTLVGNMNITLDLPPPQVGDLELQHYELLPGGHWFPRFCTARHRVAVIVPFRDREIHLRYFLNVIHSFLQRQLLQYTIFVVEQTKPKVFNKASLMNAGFLEAQSFADHDCYVFHDVDMLPESDLNFYTCSSVPRHMGSHLDKWNYILPYDELFGGVTAFSKSHFVRVNGFSNQYYGWGGEDDDMYYRVKAQKLAFTRFPSTVARYTMIKHDHDRGNPMNHRRLKLLYHKNRESIYTSDGLNSIRYKVRRYEARPLYSWMELELPPHPSEIDGEFWAGMTSAGGRSNSKNLFSIFVVLLFLVAGFLAGC